MDMPFHLKTLPPEALDVLRFFAGHSDDIARSDEVMTGSGLNERRFGVALRRLVTKGYLIMDGYQTYRLSESGRRAATELTDYESYGDTALGRRDPAHAAGAAADECVYRF
jgi:predicted transcriptional regulator